MKPGAFGLEPAGDLSSRLDSIVNQSSQYQSDLKQIDWFVCMIEPLIDSANAVPADWEKIAQECEQDSDVSGFVIAHGTDTLAYTASALAFLLSHIDKPVVITGAQKPLEALNSDAPDNLVGALKAANTAPAGVWVFFDNKLMPAANVVKKDSTAYDAFATPGLLLDGKPSKRQELKWQTTPRPWAKLFVPVIHVTPGFDAEQIAPLITFKPKAIILKLYGVGSIAHKNTALINVLEKLRQQDTLLVAVSQCYIGRVDFSIYHAGSKLNELGVIGAQNMTLEAAYTKLLVLLRMGYTQTEVKTLFCQPIAGELSYP